MRIVNHSLTYNITNFSFHFEKKKKKKLSTKNNIFLKSDSIKKIGKKNWQKNL